MKKTLIALAAISAFSSTAFAAADIHVNPDAVKISGEASFGGYYNSDSDKIINDGTSGLTVKADYDDGVLFGNAEVDVTLEDNYGTAVESDVDKLVVGVHTNYGSVSLATDNNTAIDLVSDAGDTTVEFGHTASDAGDAHNVVTYSNGTSTVYGQLVGAVSFAERDQFGGDFWNRGAESENREGETVTSGFIGLEAGPTYNVYVGVETSDSQDTYLVSANTTVAHDIKLGGTVFNQEHNDSGDSENGLAVSAGKNMNEKLYVAAGYGLTNSDWESRDVSAFNLGATYAHTEAVDFLVDVRHDVDSNESDVFAKAVYKF